MQMFLKRLLAAALSFALVSGISVGAAPVAFAAEPSQEATATATATASVETTSNVAVSNTVAPVATAGTDVCEIGSTRYATLQDALNATPQNTPTTIKLLRNISVTTGLSISYETITFDLDGYTLALSNTGGNGLTLTDSVIEYSNPGSFTASAIDGSALVIKDGSCELTGASMQLSTTNNGSSAGKAIASSGDAKVVVNGDVSASGLNSNGVSSFDNSQVIVNGNVLAKGRAWGVFPVDSSQITVNGNIIATSGDGVSTNSPDARVKVIGDIRVGTNDLEGYLSNAVYAGYGAVVTVQGNLVATGKAAYGVIADEGSQVTVTGNISTDNGEGVHADGKDTRVTVTGNILARGEDGANWAVNTEHDAEVVVTGNIIAKGEQSAGVCAVRGYATINGNVTARDGTGVFASPDFVGPDAAGARVTINGAITALTYITLGNATGYDAHLKPSDFTT
ncbi:MAG: right-handed parallel beta-helix repeat-containing protein, partial [Coriobacteriia bacterium]|nr:right-handed parallel beta-helix repeat-containing protein [Coriobacteriia bacterium]